MVAMVPVTSSNVKAVGYDAAAKRLHVQFHSGGEYSYANVEPHQHQALVNASSVGGHLHANFIRKSAQHPHTRHG